jgi:hypothetical protein
VYRVFDRRLLDVLLRSLASQPKKSRLINIGGGWLFGPTADDFSQLSAFARIVPHLLRILEAPEVDGIVIHPAMVYTGGGGVFHRLARDAAVKAPRRFFKPTRPSKVPPGCLLPSPWLCSSCAAHIRVDAKGRGIFEQKFARPNLKFPNIDRGPSTANEQGPSAHKLCQFGSVRCRLASRSLDKIGSRHDLCAKRACLLLKSSRDIDGIADDSRTKAFRSIDGAGPDLAVLQTDRDRNRRISDLGGVKP